MGLDYALVLRWHWVVLGGSGSTFEGQLLYFPDYDPASLRIFATEVFSHRPSALC